MHYMGVRAVARAETAPPPIATEKNDKNRISSVIFIGAQRARNRARAHVLHAN